MCVWCWLRTRWSFICISSSAKYNILKKGNTTLMTVAHPANDFPRDLSPLSSLLTKLHFSSQESTLVYMSMCFGEGGLGPQPLAVMKALVLQSVGLSMSLWPSSGPWDRRGVWRLQERFSSLREKGYEGRSVTCGSSTSGAGPSPSCHTKDGRVEKQVELFLGRHDWAILFWDCLLCEDNKAW